VALSAVVGRPIRVARREAPTDAEVEAVLGEYKAALLRLYYRYRCVMCGGYGWMCVGGEASLYYRYRYLCVMCDGWSWVRGWVGGRCRLRSG